jgi:hypothetical protein
MVAKADLDDGFARISVTLLWAWTAAGLSGIERAVLDIVVADTWGRPERNPGYLSNLTQADIVALLSDSGVTSARGARRAVSAVIDAQALLIGPRKKLALNPHFPATLEDGQKAFLVMAKNMHEAGGKKLPNGKNLPNGDSGNGKILPSSGKTLPTNGKISPPENALNTKSLSENTGALVSNPGAGEVEQGEVV